MSLQLLSAVRRSMTRTQHSPTSILSVTFAVVERKVELFVVSGMGFGHQLVFAVLHMELFSHLVSSVIVQRTI
jgi:hypothetical protein